MMELHSLDRKIDHSKTHKPIGHDRYSRDRAQNNKLAKVRESENLMGAMVTISNEQNTPMKPNSKNVKPLIKKSEVVMDAISDCLKNTKGNPSDKLKYFMEYIKSKEN